MRPIIVTRPHDPLNHLRVAAPCEVAWDSMIGDERARHCSLCSLNVYNFAEMTGDEIRALLLRTEGRICGRLYRRADGTVLTSDCPTGLRAMRRRMSRFAAAAIAALFSVSAFASGGTSCAKPALKKHGSNVKFEFEHVATSQPAVFTGVVRDAKDGNPLPGVTITLRNEAAMQHEITAITDANGAFRIPALSDGLYSVTVSLEGFTSAVLEHLELKQNDVTHASVSLRFAAGFEMGIIVLDPDTTMPSQGVSTTFSQDLINKLPI